MFDEDSAAVRRTVRLVRLLVIAVAATVVGWYALQFRPSRLPQKSPRTQVAILRDHEAKPFARLIAAEAIDEADAVVLRELTAELSAGDDAGRQLSAFALGRLGAGASAAADALIARLDDPSQSVRQQAAIALGRIGARPEDAAAALARSVRGADDEVRTAEFKALRRLGAAGIHRLIGLLDDAEADLRRRAAIELGRIDDADSEVIAALRGRLHDADPRVRAETLAALWRHSASRIDELIAALRDADPLVQLIACTVLERLGADAKPAIPELANLVAANGDSAWSAGQVLVSIDRDDPEIISLLAPLLVSDDRFRIQEAAGLFLHLGKATDAVRRGLLEHIDDPREYVADRAFDALWGVGLEGRLRPPELIDALAEAGESVLSLVLHHEEVSYDYAHGMPYYYPSSQTGYGITDRDLARLGGLKNLRLLDLSANPVGDAGLESIARMENLEWLLLYDTQVTSSGLAHLSRLPRLRSLGLGGCKVTDEGLAHLRQFPALESLDLRRTLVTDDGMRRLAGLKTMKAIWLDETEVSEAGLAHLGELPLLQDLGYFTKPRTLRELAQIKGLTALRPPPESVNEEDLALLANMPRLRELDLSQSNVTDAGLKHIGKLTQLETLSLGGTKITDAGLPELRALVNLKFLHLPYNGPAGPGGSNVQKPGITDAGRKALEEVLPKLVVPMARGSGMSPRADDTYQVLGLKPDDEPDAAPPVP